MSNLLEIVSKLVNLLKNGKWQTYVKMAAFILFIRFIWKYRARRHATIPMRPGFIPIIGHTLHLLGLTPNPQPELERIDANMNVFLKMNKDAICSTRFGNWSTIFLFDPKLVKFVFEDNFDDFVKGEQINERLFELLGNGIFASDGSIWRKHRKVGSKMFSMRNLKNYMFQVAKSGNVRWMKKIEELRQKNNEIDIYNLLSIYTLDVFVEIAFGQSLEIIESIPKPHPFSQAFDNALNQMAWRFRVPFFKLFRSLNLFHEVIIKKNVSEINKFANKMIESVEKDVDGNTKLGSNVGKLSDASGKGKHNILSLFLQDNPELTTTELRDIAMNFIIGMLAKLSLLLLLE